MTLTKAIEILTLEVTVNLDSGAEDFNSAVKLGIEALKRVEVQNKYRSVSQRWLLPGEIEK